MSTYHDHQHYVRRQRWSRRGLLQGSITGGAGLAAALLAGCRKGEKPAAAPTGKEPKLGGILTRAGGLAGSWDSQGRRLDSHTEGVPVGQNLRLFYQGLLAYNLRSYELEPELAQKWEQPSPTEYVLTLQPGVKWQNKPPASGRELKIEDVLFSLDRIRTPDPRFFHSALFDGVDKVEAVQRTTLRITMKAPDAGFLTKLSADPVMIMAPEVVERADKFGTPAEAVGTGPFIIRSKEDNVGAEYVRNPDYWKPGRPYLDGLRTAHFEDEQLSFAAFQAGQLDISRVPGTDVKAYIQRQGPGYTPAWADRDVAVHCMAQTKHKPMDDARVPKALRLLMDHKELIGHGELFYGRARHSSIFPISLSRWDLTQEEYERHLEWRPNKDEAVRTALDLLRAAGFSRENPLKFEVITFSTGTNLRTAELLQAQWRRLSQGVVDATIKPTDSALHTPIRARREFQYAYLGNAGGASEPDVWLVQLYRTGGSRNYQDYSDPKLDAMIDAQRSIFDFEQRKARIKEIILHTIENAPGVIPFDWWVLVGTTPKVRDHVPDDWLNGRQYEWVWLDV